MTRTVAIVGGGISGLALAEALQHRAALAGVPVRPVILEAEAEAGGKIKTAVEGGFVVETGPHGFLDREPKMFALIDRLSLGGSLLRANEAAAKRFIVRRGALRELPSSPPKFLTSDVLPLSGKLRVLLEPFARRRPDGEESVWGFAARRIGPQAADVLVDAMVTGIYGGDPKRLALRSAFPRMYELETQYGGLIRAQLALAKEKRKALPAGDGAAKGGGAGGPAGTLCSFTGGLGELTSALARRAEIRGGFAAAEIERRQGGYTVRSAAGALEAEAMVLAIPAYDAATLLAPHAEVAARRLLEIPYVPVTVVVQAFRQEDVLRPTDGFGFLIPGGEQREILGSIWASSVFPVHAPRGAVMFRTMLGGARRPELAEGGDAAILARSRAELERFVGIRPGATALLERVIRWPRAIPQYVLGHAGRVAAAEALEADLPGLYLTGNAYRGVAMLSCVAEADRLAERILRDLG